MIRILGSSVTRVSPYAILVADDQLTISNALVTQILTVSAGYTYWCFFQNVSLGGNQQIRIGSSAVSWVAPIRGLPLTHPAGPAPASSRIELPNIGVDLYAIADGANATLSRLIFRTGA